MGRKTPAAHAEYMRKWRERKRVAEVEAPHGTDNGYRNYGCRCDACRGAATEAIRPHRSQNVTQGVRRNEARASEAQNHYKRWTSAELEYATARDQNGDYLHTRTEVALRLDRSYRSIGHMRAKCMRDPKYIELLGASQ